MVTLILVLSAAAVASRFLLAGSARRQTARQELAEAEAEAEAEATAVSGQ